LIQPLKQIMSLEAPPVLSTVLNPRANSNSVVVRYAEIESRFGLRRGRIKNTFEEDASAAALTRSSVQLHHPIKAMKDNNLLDSLQIEAEWKEILLQSISQNKSQHNEIKEMNSIM
jgi:hypothetical protein